MENYVEDPMSRQQAKCTVGSKLMQDYKTQNLCN